MTGILPIGRFDGLVFDITLEQKSSVTGDMSPVTTGGVGAFISLWPPSQTPVAGTSASLSHAGDGRWVGEVQTQVLTPALAAIPDNTQVAVIYTVNGVMVRYREAMVTSIRRVEAL